MPEKETLERAARDKREGKAPSTQAGEFIREEMHHIREGKHGARSAKQAVAIGLSKARRAGVDLPPPAEGEASEKTRQSAERAYERGHGAPPRSTPSAKRSRAISKALKREGRRAASHQALSRQAHSAASHRTAADRSAAAKRAARTKGPAERSAAARKAARTHARAREISLAGLEWRLQHSRPHSRPHSRSIRAEVHLMSTHLTSPSIHNGQRIPAKYTQDGENLSPPVSWTGIPPGAKELALIVEDPDAPRPEPFIHWVIYKIPSAATGLPEGMPPEIQVKVPPGALQGTNSYNKIGYAGPAPPPGHGTHHYHFRLYALDKPLIAQGRLDNKALIAAMSGHVLEESELIGTYER